MSKLGELEFTDLYVRLDMREPSRYSPKPKRGAPPARNLPVPAEFEDDIEDLRQELERQIHDDFALDLEDMRMRGSRCSLFGEQRWVALRRLPLDPPKIEDLGFRPDILKAFRSFGQKSGLVVVGGSTRAGKTTTAVALLTDFLRTHGGVAYCIEDPVEYYLQGHHGDGGYCFQREVHEDREWGEAVKTALRWAPRYIFLGEVRTAGAAKWLLRAATSGHMAICTVHGGSIEETLSAILQIAMAELGETAPNILADGLCAVVHQQIVQGRVSATLLNTEGTHNDAVRVAIRSNKLLTLGTEIERQNVIRQRTAEEDGSAEGGRSPARPATSRPVAAARPAAAPGTARSPVSAPVRKPAAPPRKKFLGIF